MSDRVALPRPADVLLADGRIAGIRPMVAADRDGLMALHDAAGDESLRLRFFAVNREISHKYVDHLVTGSGDTVATLVATLGGRIVALATAERVAPDVAEAAFLVADAEHHHGLGGLLLEHLAAACRDVGVRRFVADVLPENAAMIRVFRDAGYTLSKRTEPGVVLIEMSTEASAAAVEAADRRESVSEARSLAPLFHPRTVAVVGVRRDGAGMGHAVLTSILAGGFTGDVYVVHPELTSVPGVGAVPHLTDVPGRVDIAVIAVPAARVLDAMQDAARAGVAAVVVISSGLGDLGPEGAELQRELLRIAREHNIRLVGPNCLGVMVNDPEVRLNGTCSPSVPPPGGLAIASQSGGVGIALLDVARELGVGVSDFISLGNKADVSGNDLLAAWLDDPAVSGAALYLESFGNAAKFARNARRFAEQKPLLAVVGGRSASGQRGRGASLRAPSDAPGVGVEALFSQAGVIACTSAEEMCRTALLLAEQPLPAGRRIAIVSNAGGLGVLAADAADLHGLAVPELSTALRAELRSHVAGMTGTSNPVDLGAEASADHFVGAIAPLLASGETDALLVVLVPTSVSPAQPLVDALALMRVQFPDKPVVLVGLGGLGQGVAGVTVFRAVDDAVAALGHTARYAEWRATPRSAPEPHDPERAATAHNTARALVDADTGPGGGWVDSWSLTRLLRPYGLEAVEGIAHHTLGGVELALGIVRDPGFGPLVMVAAGDHEVGEVGEIGTIGTLDDRTFLLPPFTKTDAARAIRSLRIWPLLNGRCGAVPAITDDLEQMVVDLGELALDVAEIVELDLNPVLCTSLGATVGDARVRLAVRDGTRAWLPRQLRVRA